MPALTQSIFKELEDYASGGFDPVSEHSAICVAHGEGQECCLEKEWVKSFLLSSLSRLGREVVGAVPNIQDELPRDERREKTEEVTGISRQSFDCCGEGEMNGWNSAREAVIKALKDNGVELN